MTVTKAEREFCILTLREIDNDIPIRYVGLIQDVLKKKNLVRTDKEIRDARVLRKYDFEIVIAFKTICKNAVKIPKDRVQKSKINTESIIKKLKLKY